MAWTLYLLIGITVVTTSAHKCKQPSYSNPDGDPNRQYEYQSQGPSGIPNARIYDRMNIRSINLAPPAYLTHIPEQTKKAQLKIEEPAPRSENASKVLTWKPYTESRQASMVTGRRDAVNDPKEQNTDNYKIVFPGPTSEEFQLEIPEKCKKIGICEEIHNYPRKQADLAIANLPNKKMLQNDKLDIPALPDIHQRVGPQEENIDLCNFQQKVVYPKAAVDEKGNWHVVLNQDDNPLQGFKVEICDVDSSPCSDIVTFQQGYEGRCLQKYVYRKMAVLHNGTYLEKTLKVPSCCSCVAKLSIR